MFSAKNYGLPKDLIEAAKRVHEKQLEEGVGKYAEPRIDPKIRDKKNTAAVSKALHDLAGRERKKNIEKLPEEVQFTEEELAEAFAIFLEENFHVEMLTEEDLDYVFEEEFPQWLEEQRPGEANRRADMEREKYIYSSKLPETREQHRAISRGAKADLTRIMRNEIRGAPAEMQRLSRQAAPSEGQNPKKEKGGLFGWGGFSGSTQKSRQNPKIDMSDMPGTLDDGGEESKTPIRKIKKDIERARSEVKKSSTPSNVRKQVSAKPTSPARKQTGGPSLFQQAKKAVRPTPGDSGRTATDRLKYMARRGNKASQRALRGPKKDWRSSVFNPDGN